MFKQLAVTALILPARCSLCLLLLVGAGFTAHADEPSTTPSTVDPLSPASRQKLKEDLGRLEEQLTKQIQRSPDSVDLYSARGDARFFQANFATAVADYEKMLKLQPDLDARHWRLGLAWFYAGKYADGAHQFEKYYETDDVDRENGLWRFLCQVRELGLEKARQKMLKYTKPDRGGLGEVYRMYAGELTVDKIVAGMNDSPGSEEVRNQRLFYGHLYIGLYESVQNHRDKALEHLKKAVENPWPRREGYGPNYMWHVARLHYELTEKEKKAAAPSPARK